MAPFSFSVAVSFGSSGPLFLGSRQQHMDSEDEGEPYIPQSVVVGTIMAIFMAQVGFNLIHGIRAGRARREALRREVRQGIDGNAAEREREQEQHGEAQDEGEGLAGRARDER